MARRTVGISKPCQATYIGLRDARQRHGRHRGAVTRIAPADFGVLGILSVTTLNVMKTLRVTWFGGLFAGLQVGLTAV